MLFLPGWWVEILTAKPLPAASLSFILQAGLVPAACPLLPVYSNGFITTNRLHISVRANAAEHIVHLPGWRVERLTSQITDRTIAVILVYSRPIQLGWNLACSCRVSRMTT
ncbi:MAG: hypothetical protein DRP56_01635 [Planctomycetota bacterium]|nr:MAG: hypothetical protein DRP56_01635 [Planctomycetota bacterium]